VFLRLLILFTLIPVVELALLIQLGQFLGVLPTVVLVLATGALGAALARSQGSQAWHRLQTSLSRGTFPGEELINGVLILAGGLLLLTPGILTDLIGFAALIPGSRHMIKAYLKRRINQRVISGEVDANYEVH
jgi:UPF0716 protein FxsA